MSSIEVKPDCLEYRLRLLRDAAMAHLAGNKASYDAAGAVAAFDGIEMAEGEAQSVLALETFVAVVIARNRRPRRAQGSLYKLFQAYRASGEPATFFAFQNQIKAAAEHGFSLEKITFFQWLADIDQDGLWRDTATALQEVTDMVGPAFLNSGTLLGAVRDKSFIAHDDDVDIAVLLKSRNAEDAGREWLEVFDTMLKAGLVEKAKRRSVGVFKMRSSYEGISIDVFPAWIEDERIYVYPHTAGDLKRDDVMPLAKCTTTGLPIPRNPEAMLEVNYGAGWREPDPSFVFDWTRANRRFRRFWNAMEEVMKTADAKQ